MLDGFNLSIEVLIYTGNMFRYFERIKRPLTSGSDGSSNDPNVVIQSEINISESSGKKARIENEEDIVVDPTLQKPIVEYDPQIRDEVGRRYVLKGPCQP